MKIHPRMIVTAENAPEIIAAINAKGDHKIEVVPSGDKFTFTIDGRNGGFICDKEAVAMRKAVVVAIERSKPLSEHLDAVEAAASARGASFAAVREAKVKKAELKAALRDAG